MGLSVEVGWLGLGGELFAKVKPAESGGVLVWLRRVSRSGALVWIRNEAGQLSQPRNGWLYVAQCNLPAVGTCRRVLGRWY